MTAPPVPAAPSAPPAPAPAAAPSSTHSKKEEYHHHRHYVREQVREKSIRAASEPPTIEKAAPPPPIIEKAAPPPSAPPAKMPAMTYSPFPFAMPATAIPVAYAMPTSPVPVQAETASSTSSSKPKPDQRIWVGRTKKQVDEDNAKIAHKEGVYKPNEMIPKDASPDQLFWCIEPDDTNTLRRFCTIQEDLQPGKWKVDPRYGNAYFVRDKVEQEKKK